MIQFHLDLMREVYVQQVDYRINNFRADDTLDLVTSTIFEDAYDDVLTILEYLAKKLERFRLILDKDIDIYENINDVLKQEYVGYRFVDSILIPIANELETDEVAQAIKIPYDNVNKHLKKAMRYISDRNNPDYENVIKESLSAVEAMCLNILGEKGTLGDALKKLQKNNKYKLHPALENGFEKIYGYASDDDSGIRHSAGLGGSDSTFAEARFMLVACSAFVNYLKETIGDTNVIFDDFDDE